MSKNQFSTLFVWNTVRSSGSRYGYTVKLHLIDYAISCIDREVVILKPRQEALMHLHNSICCTLVVLPLMFDLKIEALTSSSAERSIVLVILPFVFLMIRQVARWAAEVINMRTPILLNGLLYYCCVDFRVT